MVKTQKMGISHHFLLSFRKSINSFKSEFRAIAVSGEKKTDDSLGGGLNRNHRQGCRLGDGSESVRTGGSVEGEFLFPVLAVLLEPGLLPF